MAEFAPYGKFDQYAINCIEMSSKKHSVPESLLHAIAKKEGGRMGQCVRNKNGTYDCGFAQINTSWSAEFNKYGVGFERVVHDACTNFDASGFILRKNFEQKKDWFKAIVSYNIGPGNWTPKRYAIGYAYAADVVKYWWGFEKQKGNYAAVAAVPTAPSAAPVSVSAIVKKKSKLNPLHSKRPSFFEVEDDSNDS